MKGRKETDELRAKLRLRRKNMVVGALAFATIIVSVLFINAAFAHHRVVEVGVMEQPAAMAAHEDVEVYLNHEEMLRTTNLLLGIDFVLDTDEPQLSSVGEGVR